MCFVILFAAALAGAVLHGPNSFDSLSYRIPRMLHWMFEERWHWINTYDPRMNTRVCGFEWLNMPLLMLTKTDRLFFLPNILSFLLLPGLIFGVFRGIGLGPRVSWSFMWLLPGGYTFLLQAGSVVNDMFSAVYLLAMIYFGLRAAKTSDAWDLSLSILSAGLLTGAKTSNIPLLLPWVFCLFPIWKILMARWVRLLVPAVIALTVSFLPTALLNARYCGDWTGYSVEATDTWTFMVKNPVAGVVGNVIALSVQNLVPPVFPVASQFNEAIHGSLSPGWKRALQMNFEGGFGNVRELQEEDSAGLGFGLGVLLVVTLIASMRQARRVRGQSSREPRRPFPLWESLLIITPWVGLVTFMAKSGISCPARLIAPYYMLLAPIFLVSQGADAIVRQRWWKATALVMMLLSLFVVVATPSRPLWPALRIFESLQERYPQLEAIERGRKAYTAYATRREIFKRMCEFLPPDARVVGMIAHGSAPETSLWRPFGQRHVRHVLPGMSRADLPAAEYWVIHAPSFWRYSKESFEQWLKEQRAEIVMTMPISMASRHTEASPWYLIHFVDSNPHPAR